MIMKMNYKSFLKDKTAADNGDFLKVMAVSAVFLQSILGFALNVHPNANTQIGIGISYNIVKFSAPAFIFSILFTNTRYNLGIKFNTKKFYLKILRGSFLPYYLWGIIYLLLFPNLQQINHYHNFQSFLWQLVSGNAAPHLWYAVMMLQFLILMPLFNLLVKWIDFNFQLRIKKFIFCLIIILILSASWLIFYDCLIFHGPKMHDWYLFDRFFMSFALYGFLGVLCAIFFEFYCDFLSKWKYLIGAILILSFIVINLELFQFGLPLNLANAPYYKPSMTFYDLSVIFLISLFAIHVGPRFKKTSYLIHKLAQIAYLAYLPNAMWSWILWDLFGKILFQQVPFLSIFIIYCLTWILSFITAFLSSPLFIKTKKNLA